MTARNDSIDREVEAAIAAGADRCASICAVHAVVMASGDSMQILRVVDRSLQRLRKTGRIELVGTPRRWKIVKRGSR